MHHVSRMSVNLISSRYCMHDLIGNGKNADRFQRTYNNHIVYIQRAFKLRTMPLGTLHRLGPCKVKASNMINHSNAPIFITRGSYIFDMHKKIRFLTSPPPVHTHLHEIDPTLLWTSTYHQHEIHITLLKQHKAKIR